MLNTTSLTAARAAELVAAFDISGIHRVGKPGDFASGAWFERETAKSALAVSRTAVPLQQTHVDEAYLECGGLRIDGLPMFDAPVTAAGGVAGVLGMDGTGDVGLAEFPSNAASIKGQPLEKLRRSTPHSALIVATRGTGDSLAPINAQYYDYPFGPPVLLVAGMHHAFLAAQAAQRAPVRLVSRYRRVSVTSFNVSTVADSGNAAPAIAVVTPRTGWWESTAERAGGMVAWLAAVQAAGSLRQAGQLKRDFHAYATCGH